jgi:effector-binding domain-containing protein
MVHTVHKGPYESCEPTYLKLFAWIETKGLLISGPIREVYPNDPRVVKPEEIITEIFIPVGLTFFPSVKAERGLEPFIYS